MISKEEKDSLRQYLKIKGAADPDKADCYKINGFVISIDPEYEGGVVFVYLIRDNWVIACTEPMAGLSSNPHMIVKVDFDGLMRLIDGGEMAYNNMVNELALDELQ